MAPESPKRQRLIVSWLMSLVGAGLLVWHHTNPSGHRLDGWSVALVILVFLPWLGPVFESINFPGGGVVFRLKEQVALQEREIKSLRFVVANFLNKDEVKYLRALAEPGEYRFGRDDDPLIASQALDRLLQLSFVRAMDRYSPAALINSNGSEMKQLFAITRSGREYLDFRDDTPSS